MAHERVYVETTIPSLYYDVRKAPKTVRRRAWTRKWWETAGERYELLTSEAVLHELAGGKAERSSTRLALVKNLPLLRISPEIMTTVEDYIRFKLMPADPGGDALHLAIASHHRCDFLVTWNCRHLANANKIGHIRGLNLKLGLFVPAIVTPKEMLGEADEGEEEETE